MSQQPELAVYADKILGQYGFENGHPFSRQRLQAFYDTFLAAGLDQRVQLRSAKAASEDELLRFHRTEHVDFVKEMSKLGKGFLDDGDTPAFVGVFEAACNVVGATVDAVHHICDRTFKRAFVPIAGLHHARRDRSAGFCVFNDIGVAIETLRAEHSIQRVAYVDIDVHHGDGVFYGFEDDPDLIFADIHQANIYPATGAEDETGKGAAKGTKLNIELQQGSGDSEFFEAFKKVEQHLIQSQPEFMILQCGADSIKGDLLGGLRYSPRAHQHTAARLREIAETYSKGRMLALGGGGYNLENIALAWTAVVRELV